jgi:hypothetical protein
MALSDAQLFDFKAGLMADYDDAQARADLEWHGDAFRYQLVAALHLSEWAETLADESDPIYESMEANEIRGWVNALQNVAAYLRQGYYLPGGKLYDEVVSDREARVTKSRSSARAGSSSRPRARPSARTPPP